MTGEPCVHCGESAAETFLGAPTCEDVSRTVTGTANLPSRPTGRRPHRPLPPRAEGHRRADGHRRRVPRGRLRDCTRPRARGRSLVLPRGGRRAPVRRLHRPHHHHGGARRVPTLRERSDGRDTRSVPDLVRGQVRGESYMTETSPSYERKVLYISHRQRHDYGARPTHICEFIEGEFRMLTPPASRNHSIRYSAVLTGSPRNATTVGTTTAM